MSSFVSQRARGLRVVFGFAAVSAAVALTALWPRATFADGDDTAAELTLDGTKVNDVIVTGEIVGDPKAKTGWVVVVEAENRGKDEATAELETDVTRQIMNMGARVGPMPTVMWKKKEKVTVAAGAKVTRRYDIPAPLAARVAAAKRAAENMEKLMAQAKKTPPRITNFAVEFKGAWADEGWMDKSRWSQSRYGDSMPMMMPTPTPANADPSLAGVVF